MSANLAYPPVVTRQYAVSIGRVASLGSMDDTDHRAGQAKRERPLLIKAGIERTGEGGLNGAV